LQSHGLIRAPLTDKHFAIADQEPCRDESKCRPGRARIGAWLRVFHAISLNAKKRHDSGKSKKGAWGMKSAESLL
jgi:hypothetical protein